nr:glycosyl hydrolase 108 family protein [uncultured Emticicia sp.]
MFLQKSKFFTTLIFIFSFQLLSAASFDKYFPKLIKFEGIGYGIHQPIWGNKSFSKNEAYQIYKIHYWNKYNASMFKSQGVAEVLIDQIINAGVGKECVNIKAFEAIIGVKQDGYLSLSDIKKANSFISPDQIINPFVNYRLHYYNSRTNAKKYRGWIIRAKSFYRKTKEGILLANYLILPNILIKSENTLVSYCETKEVMVSY